MAPIKSLIQKTIAALLFFLATPTNAFSLLGPFAPWMTPEVGFVKSPDLDVGGPRNIGDEFRWNLPLLTYGFDEEFKNFFGQPGIDAIEQVIARLNNFPPASQIDLSSAPLQTRRIHATAQSLGLKDIRSSAFAAMIEQLGLTGAHPNVWVNTSTNALESENPSQYVIQRNFDPFTFAPSTYVNNIWYHYQIRYLTPLVFPMLGESNQIAIEFAVDQPGSLPLDVASILSDWLVGYGIRVGEYFSALTREDLGGLRYLYSTNNINGEPLVPGVRAQDPSTSPINFALRPGVDKITFQRLDQNSPAITNRYTDTYILDGAVHTQQLERVITSPDILFTASNHENHLSTVRRYGPNFSHQNETGSGILYPGITISFHKFGDVASEVWKPYEESTDEIRWSIYDSRTLTITNIFPIGPQHQGARTLSIRHISTPEPHLEWKMRLIGSVEYAIETSEDLATWTQVTNIIAQPIHTLTNTPPPGTKTQFLRARRTSHQ